MTPDEWQRGIENEAASVDDGVWVRETHRTAQFQRGRRTLFLLTAATLIYVLIGSLLVMAFNALSIGYGPQGLRPIVLGSPLPSVLVGLLIPLLATLYLTRLGIRPAIIWTVPVLGSLLGSLVSRTLAIAVPLNFPDVLPGNPVDLLPSGSPDLTQSLTTVLLTALALALGIGLGRLPRRQYRSAPR